MTMGHNNNYYYYIDETGKRNGATVSYTLNLLYFQKYDRKIFNDFLTLSRIWLHWPQSYLLLFRGRRPMERMIEQLTSIEYG